MENSTRSRARIHVLLATKKQKQYILGSFNTAEQAAHAYDLAWLWRYKKDKLGPIQRNKIETLNFDRDTYSDILASLVDRFDGDDGFDKLVKWFRKVAAGQSITDEELWHDAQKEAAGAA